MLITYSHLHYITWILSITSSMHPQFTSYSQKWVITASAFSSILHWTVVVHKYELIWYEPWTVWYNVGHTCWSYLVTFIELNWDDRISKNTEHKQACHNIVYTKTVYLTKIIHYEAQEHSLIVSSCNSYDQFCFAALEDCICYSSLIPWPCSDHSTCSIDC